MLFHPLVGIGRCNRSLPHAVRIEKLLAQLTLDEKIGLLSPNATIAHNTCNCHTTGAPRVGLGKYMWLDETNTGASAACLGPGHCVTTFPGPLGIGASFNRTLWKLKGGVIGTEVRALNNIGWWRDAGGTVTEKIGLTGYGPNLNQPRDPRNGRLSELPGEDPYMSGQYGAAMLKGMQEEDAHGHPKMIALVKHFTAYSQETGRGYDTFNISQFDLFDTYLPQYEAAFKQGGASGLMCSCTCINRHAHNTTRLHTTRLHSIYHAADAVYFLSLVFADNGVNGKPSCANGDLLNKVVRQKWGNPDALITTDCGAVANLRHFPANAPTDAIASAWAINNGTDLEMGSALLLNSLKNATLQGLTTERTITTAARRTLIPLFKGGLFDKIEDIKWAAYTKADIASKGNLQVRDEAAAQSFVLLKNKESVLPLTRGMHIAVLGPQSTGTGLFSGGPHISICAGWCGACSSLTGRVRVHEACVEFQNVANLARFV